MFGLLGTEYFYLFIFVSVPILSGLVIGFSRSTEITTSVSTDYRNWVGLAKAPNLIFMVHGVTSPLLSYQKRDMSNYSFLNESESCF